MKLSVDKMFLVLGIISFPNLFFRGYYNVPLLIFFFACWYYSFKSFITYMMILSWFLDVYLLFDYITKSDEEKNYESGYKGEVVLVVSIIVFVCKERCQYALKPTTIGKNVQSLFNFEKIKAKKEQY